MRNEDLIVAATGVTTDYFHQLLDLAITGRGPLPGAKKVANQQLLKRGDVESAVEHLITQHVALASGQGFATNWGGFLVALATMPVNVAASLFLQARLVAAIAHLRGYELADPRVRLAIGICMLGPVSTASLIKRGALPSTVLAVATAPVYDDDLDRQVSRSLLERVFNDLGGKRLGAWAVRRIPVLGAGVGAGVDGWATYAIGRHARHEFVSRRPKLAA